MMTTYMQPIEEIDSAELDDIIFADAAFDDFLALDDDWLDDDEAEFIQNEENTGLLQ